MRLTGGVLSIETEGQVVVTFETDRLSARRLVADDSPWLDQMHADPEVMATLGGVRDRAASQAWLTDNLNHWASFGYGQWMLAVDGETIGRGGIRRIDASVGEDLAEIGYALARDHWGQGYATEAAQAFVRVGFDHYGFGQLGAITLIDNHASANVLEKAGFTFERSFDHPAGRHQFLRLRAEDAPKPD